MNNYSEECIQTFLEKQGQLFDEPVAQTSEEARDFLEDTLAVVVSNLSEVRTYMEDCGLDIEGMTKEDLEDAAEVFALPSGKYLIVEG